MTGGVIILDFGSQYTQLIARRIREMNVYSEIAPHHASLEYIQGKKPEAIIFSGGPASVYAFGSPRVAPSLLNLNIPVLGICYGLQLIALLTGMKVQSAQHREYGLAQLIRKGKSTLLHGIPKQSPVWMSHGDKITQLPPGFLVTGSTANTEMAVLESDKKKVYGVQFHPEVIHTREGKKILANFLFSIACIKPNWTMKSFISSTTYKIRKQIAGERVLLGLSGGVDSTVLALLLKKAIGNQVIPVFVDTGLLRKDEFSNLMKCFRKTLKLHVIGVNASGQFLKRLGRIRSPEKKRKIIGSTFIDIFRKVENEIGSFRFFAQGTLYPDVIESVSVKGPSATIKSHHNVGGLPKKLKWELIEPLRELFKDEVRQLGRELGMDPVILNRHPFPGPGLAVRIIGSITPEKIRKLQEADAILINELHKADLYDKVWQAFAVLLPVKSVGVMGDERTYEEVVVLRMVESVDGMTANWFAAPHEFLARVSNRIVNEVKGINRVTYDLTSKPPGTIEWE